jgi:hypothetical protein
MKLLPKYPIYVISKGRSDPKSRMTQRSLEEINCPYRIVVEPQEYDDYARYVDPKKILVTPFSNLGQGSIPVRNFVWEHSIQEGHKKHWILDDNMRYFYRLHKNKRIRMTTPTFWRACENFVDRYSNVKMSGLNYRFFCPSDQKKPPYYVNTRVYSCILLDNSLDFRWRGQYNEDTDLSLRILKDGHCTILFNQFLTGKAATHTMSGGNTEEVYNVGGESFDNRREFAESLKAQHPDVVNIVERYGRWHHEVNYSVFIQKPKLRKNIILPKTHENYGLKLITLTQDQHEKEKQMKLLIENGA